MFSLNEILKITTLEQIELFLKKHSGFTLSEHDLFYDKVSKSFKYVGNSNSNYSEIAILNKGEKGLIERITNAIDAVIEKQSVLCEKPKTADDVVAQAFPRYYNSKLNNNKGRMNAVDTEGQINVVFRDGTKYKKPTVDIIDKGTGIPGNLFESTILSLHGGNKINTNKSYLIGAFGHGGSTSLTHTKATILISKFDGHYYFTIVKAAQFEDNKLPCYMYFVVDNVIPECINDVNEINDEEIMSFVYSESGTLIRMIDLDTSGTLNQLSQEVLNYCNIELYKTVLPVRLIEKRLKYMIDSKNDVRYVYGSNRVLQNSKFCKHNLSGTIKIDHNNRNYDIAFYVILPENEDDWGNDTECKQIYKKFNFHEKPIIYVINGQYVSGENFTKLKNRGLEYLKYRLLVEVNLDNLGNEKYRFFTTDRNNIQENELTSGFVDKVIDAICQNETLKDLNKVIAEKTVKTKINSEFLNNIKQSISEQYNDFIKQKEIKQNPRHNNKSYGGQESDEVYNDEILTLFITTKNNAVFEYGNIPIHLHTGAFKNVNKNANIDCIVDNRTYYFDAHSKSNRQAMNGRILYNLNDLSVGEHTIFFSLNGKTVWDNVDSNKIKIQVIKQQPTKETTTKTTKDIDIQLAMEENKEYIIDIHTNKEEKRIVVSICLSHELLQKHVWRTVQNKEAMRDALIEPLSLFVLFMGEQYDQLQSVDDKNNIALSFCKSYINILTKQK